jgi:hypothetical protein
VDARHKAGHDGLRLAWNGTKHSIRYTGSRHASWFGAHVLIFASDGTPRLAERLQEKLLSNVNCVTHLDRSLELF